MKPEETTDQLIRPLDYTRKELDIQDVIDLMGLNEASKNEQLKRFSTFNTVYKYHPRLPKDDVEACKKLLDLYNLMGHVIIEDMERSAVKYQGIIGAYQEHSKALRSIHRDALEYSGKNLLPSSTVKESKQKDDEPIPATKHALSWD